MNLELFKHVYFRLPRLIRIILTLLLAMLLFGVTIHLIEPQTFPTIFDGIWWAFVTGSTVGYGDYIPLTRLGRIIAILLILTGGGLITFYITVFAASIVQHERNLSDGKVAYKGNHHIILVGWNERTKILIDRTIQHSPKTEIVLIDQSLSYLSYQLYKIHFIHGDPTDDYYLQMANIQEASKVIITADNERDEKQADNHSILTTVAIRGNNKRIPIIVEILSTNQIDNAIRAGATTILRPNDFMSSLLYHEIFKNKSRPFESVLQLLASQQFRQYKLPEAYHYQPFIEVLYALQKTNHLLIGIIRDEKWILNPDKETILQPEDIVLTLISWD
ncbi:potassium channel family protein [Ornithinibacillus contaminans]|uniref:potassium channel family protein n=1 Tax=Ornithinibacillus contaminans TaxID=694055 RepID=UPI00064D82CB|nr:ion channel [Ornithinibacillus contaminans]